MLEWTIDRKRPRISEMLGIFCSEQYKDRIFGFLQRVVNRYCRVDQNVDAGLGADGYLVLRSCSNLGWRSVTLELRELDAIGRAAVFMVRRAKCCLKMLIKLFHADLNVTRDAPSSF